MNNNPLRILTWGTAAAALGSAVLLTGESSGVPDLVERRAAAAIAVRANHAPARQRHAAAPARSQGSGVPDGH